MPITDFMHRLGCKSTKKRGKEVWFHAPYRSDSTPSFCVNTEKNIFNDFNQNFYYNVVLTTGGHGKASECIQCGQCEGICPQGLPIITLLQDVAKTFEE